MKTNFKNPYRGVYWRADKGKFHVKISLKGVVKTLGFFDEMDDAITARVKAEEENGIIYENGKRISQKTELKKGLEGFKLDSITIDAILKITGINRGDIKTIKINPEDYTYDVFSESGAYLSTFKTFKKAFNFKFNHLKKCLKD